MPKKRKATIDEMVEIFDNIWAEDPMRGGERIIQTWTTVCKDHGWTDDEFEDALDKWQEEKRKSA